MTPPAMNRLSRHHLLFVAAAAAALGSASFFLVLGARDLPAKETPPGQLAFSGSAYEPAFAAPPASRHETWDAPAAQPRGREWVYEVFTPPEIFYHAAARRFTVTPPAGAEDGALAEPFGLELVAVKPEPFRLQLIGYVGGEGNWRGTFENALTGEVFLAGAGRRVPELALTILSLEVGAQPVALPDSMTTRQRVATAVVRDERTGREVRLTHRERRLAETMSALVAPAGESPTREVRAGETVPLGAALFRIDRIQLSPPSIDVTKQSPQLAQPEHRTLVPREPDVGDAPATTPG
jgi:hypothetical protein